MKESESGEAEAYFDGGGGMDRDDQHSFSHPSFIPPPFPLFFTHPSQHHRVCFSVGGAD
jgi:hypothetical protein